MNLFSHWCLGLISIAVAYAGPELHWSKAYVEVVAPVLGFGWRHLDRMPDDDQDELIGVMVRIYDASGRATLPLTSSPLDHIQRVIHPTLISMIGSPGGTSIHLFHECVVNPVFSKDILRQQLVIFLQDMANYDGDHEECIRGILAEVFSRRQRSSIDVDAESFEEAEPTPKRRRLLGPGFLPFVSSPFTHPVTPPICIIPYVSEGVRPPFAQPQLVGCGT